MLSRIAPRCRKVSFPLGIRLNSARISDIAASLLSSSIKFSDLGKNLLCHSITPSPKVYALNSA